MSDERHDVVSRRAYELWQQEGGGHGHHEDHWHRAMREVTEESVNVTAPDGTTMPVATAVEELGEEQQAPARTPHKRAAAKPAADTDPASPPASSTKAPAKSRKPKAK